MSKQVIIQANNISKSYHDGNQTIDVLNNINFTINRGDCIAIVGPSGSGKSTFLHVLGGLDNPSQGEVLIQAKNWQTLNEKQRCQLRNQYLGFVYQFHHLLPEFSALENVAMPLLLANKPIKEARLEAQALLVQVGLEARVHHKPSELSGGERQRVAIARALVHRPHCLFADEPTGNLDEATANQIIDLLLRLNKTFKTALVIVTHDKQLADKMDITVSLKAGTLTQV